MPIYLALTAGLGLLSWFVLPPVAVTQAAGGSRPPKESGSSVYNQLARPRAFTRSMADRQDVVITTYDRVEDRTRVTIVLVPVSRRFGLGSSAWLDVSFSYPGRQLREPPDSLLFAVESFTPARGGWAFKRSLMLRAEAGEEMRLEYPTSEYTRYPVRVFDQGRRELLLFQVSAVEIPVLTNVDELTLRVGHWKARLTEEQLELLRNIARGEIPDDQ